MLPTSVVWEDGTVYGIDRVLDVRKAAAQRAGSGGDRYTVKIKGKQTFIFFERTLQTGAVCGRWFVERREPAPF